MTEVQFDRDAMARYYAKRHARTDDGIGKIYHLPVGAPDREVRLLEVNDEIIQRDENPLEPLDFGVDTGSENAHTLYVLDVTSEQLRDVIAGRIALPAGWTLDGLETLIERPGE